MSRWTEISHNKEYSLKYQRSFKLALTVSTLLKSWCFKTQVELKGQGYMVKMLIPTEESCHNEYTCVNVWDNLDLNVRQKIVSANGIIFACM